VIVESEADVAATLLFAQKWKLDLVVASGRHSYYGASSTTGGVVVDLQN
jgi:FAD/FMN-containing dehydrogenase